MRTRRGLSLPEAIMALALLSMLTVVTFQVYRMGAMSWRKAEGQNDLLNQVQVVTSRLAREMERSVYASASVDANTALSFLSPVNVTTGEVVFSPATQTARWQQYLVFYFVPATREVMLRSVPLLGTDPECDNPEPIELYDTGGLNPLYLWRAQGKVLSRDIYACDFSLGDGILQLTLRADKPAIGTAPPETLLLRTTCVFRN